MGRLIPSIYPCCVIGGCIVFRLPGHGEGELCLQQVMLHPQKLPQTDQLPEAQASRLLLGDCVERLAELADNSVDCILTDPPYGYNYLSKSKTLPLVRIANDRAEAYPLQDRALAAACPKLKDGAWAFIFTNWQCYPAMAGIVSRYFPIKNVLIWHKNAWSKGDLKGNWGYEHEFIIAARKGATRVRRFLHGKREGNVLPFKKVPTQAMQHPTEKPVELLTYLIEKVTQPGEVVLDMFAGVGSTGVAAQHAGRRSILIELQAEWARIAAERLGVAVSCP
jgi:site-specific DNA-methyltransferase (adenine-specific)